ncbi:hypothetical protein B9Z55_023114 [Caenorhabditis nigoni]|uniref:Uncharacterized protein n=1 Tax=Caenorhabditis nigoni TaxID=1611254 RepID=A0A2G5SNL3_9PELO|nr:hypothetical protein B9Z55_023114 [Caenorhabditis nigoni]
MYKFFGCMYYNALIFYENVHRIVEAFLILAHILYVTFADDFINSALASLVIYVPAIVLSAIIGYLLSKIYRTIKSKHLRTVFIFCVHIFLFFFPLVPRVLVFFVGWNFQTTFRTFTKIFTADSSCQKRISWGSVSNNRNFLSSWSTT